VLYVGLGIIIAITAVERASISGCCDNEALRGSPELTSREAWSTWLVARRRNTTSESSTSWATHENC
jgi:hypothetical protein